MITFFNVHLISPYVTESDITYKSSVDISLELYGVWIGGEGGGGWDLEIEVNKILEVWEYKAKCSQCFLPEAWLFNACFPIFDSSVLFLGIGQTQHFAVILLPPQVNQDLILASVTTDHQNTLNSFSIMLYTGLVLV